MQAERFWYVRELIAAGPGKGCQPIVFAAAVLFFGIWPDPLFDLARDAGTALSNLR